MAKLYHKVYQKSKFKIVFFLFFYYNITYLEVRTWQYVFNMLMPASISILIEKRIIKKELSNSDLILKYLLYTFLITTIMNTFIYIFSSEKLLHYSEYTFSYDFCLKYMWLSLIIALILPYILKVISANIDINLEIRKKVKNEKKKKGKKRSSKKSSKSK